MRNKLIIFLVITFILFLSYYVFESNFTFTGLVVNEILDESVETPLNSSVSQTNAINALNYSEIKIQELIEDNLPTFYVNDMYEEASIVYQQAYYAEILRGDFPETQKNLATKELKLVNWRNIDYSDVLIYTKNINEHVERVYFLGDSIELEEKRLREYYERGIAISEESLNLLNKTKVAFSNDQLNDCEEFLIEYRTLIESDLSRQSTLGVLENNAKNFLQRYWVYVLFAFLFLIGIYSYLYGVYRLRKLEHKISRMKHERIILTNLIKKTQDERFNKGSIPDLVYKIRMKKYKEKLDEIKQKLPVLESKLKKKRKRAKKKVKKFKKKTNKKKFRVKRKRVKK